MEISLLNKLNCIEMDRQCHFLKIIISKKKELLIKLEKKALFQQQHIQSIAMVFFLLAIYC